MAIYYLDLENGNDSNDGTSFANRWKTLTSGATAARIAPGDTIRIMGSLAPTLVDSAGVWTTGPSEGTKSVTGATNASPIVLTVSAHGYSNGDIVRVLAVGGNTAAIGIWEVANVTTNTFELKDSTGNGAYTSGGTVQRINNLVVKIPAVLVKFVDDGRTAWTAANSATCTTDAATYRDATASAQITMPGSPATGTLYAYKAYGSAQDFSAYQQLTFWIRVSAATIAGNLKLCLCSDNAGATIVDTFQVPAIVAANQWTAITVDKGSALGASIQSVALYSDTSTSGLANVVVRLDNIHACKASSSNDSISMTTLIGKAKARRQSIASSTNATPIVVTCNAHGLANGDYVYITDHATNTNANGIWKVANVAANTFELVNPVTGANAVGNGVGGATGTFVCQETWWTVDNLTVNSTTTIVGLAASNSTGIVSRGYMGTSETVATYKRVPIKVGMGVSNNTANNTVQDSGTAGSNITFSGGWDRTNMTTQDGDTWLDGENFNGRGINISSKNFVTLDRLHGVRLYSVLYSTVGNQISVGYMSGGSTGNPIFHFDQQNAGCFADFLVASGGGVFGLYLFDCHSFDVGFVSVQGCTNANYGGVYARCPNLLIRTLISRNNTNTGLCANTNLTVLSGYSSSNSVAGIGQQGSSSLGQEVRLSNMTIDDSVECSFPAFTRVQVFSHNHDNTPANHKIFQYGCTITAQTAVREKASGLDWNVQVTNSNISQQFPAQFRIARVACNANQQVSVTARLRRDNTGLTLRLICPKQQLAGLESDTSSDFAASANTWGDATINFTPTTDGVVDIYLYAWGGTTYNGYLDKLTITVNGASINPELLDTVFMGEPFAVDMPTSGGGGAEMLLIGAGSRGGL